MCQRFTELRNITKGPCSLPGVEVSYCSGRCRSRTAVTPEVSPGQRQAPVGCPPRGAGGLGVHAAR